MAKTLWSFGHFEGNGAKMKLTHKCCGHPEILVGMGRTDLDQKRHQADQVYRDHHLISARHKQSTLQP